MPRILFIDDDRIIRKLVENSLTKIGFEVITAESGAVGLEIVHDINPDLVVTDKLMPDVDGLEVTRRLRKEPKFANTPIIVLTGESELEDKLGAFEAGADDYLSKPFEHKELVARITALLRRAQAFKTAKEKAEASISKAHITAVHSLRGGIGCSSIAVNLALSYQNLWNEKALLVDLVLGTGQLSLMLNKQLKHSWANLVAIQPEELDFQTISKIVSKHESDLHFIAAPADPIIAERVSGDLIHKSLNLLRPRFKYIVADLPHNFSNSTLEILDLADQILLVVAPDMASIRAASTALNVYSELGYESDKIKLILNSTFNFNNIPTAKIEAALKHAIASEIPYAPKQFITGINRGKPIVDAEPESNLSALFEMIAFDNSLESHKAHLPTQPTVSWHRINSQLKLFNTKSNIKKKTKGRSRLLFSSG